MLASDALTTPALLQRLQWVIDPVGFMETAAREHPDLFSAQIVGFGEDVIFVHHPQAVQEILLNDRKKFAALSTYNELLVPLIGRSGVMMLDGDRHRRRRQLVMPPFHGDRMRNYGQTIIDLTTKVFDQLPKERPFTARTAMQAISLQVILQVVFGLDQSERCQELRQLIARMADIFESPLSSSFLFFPFLQKDWGAWSPWSRFLRQRQRIDQLLYAEIRDGFASQKGNRRQHPDPERSDILSMLIAARDEQGEPLTDQELRDELMTLLIAGHETTATAMTWALYWLHQLPEVKEKLLAELDACEEPTDPMTLFRLPYLTAVCQETLRIHPVAMLTFPRVVQESLELLGQRFEPGAILMGCIYLIHQREDLYPQPKQFKPERFLERQFSPYEFIPFGGGVRRCLGEALALFELKLVLATILSNYELALVDSRPERPQRRGVTLAPATGVKMRLVGKRSQAKPADPSLLMSL